MNREENLIKSREQLRSLVEKKPKALNPELYEDSSDSNKIFQELMAAYYYLKPDWINEYNSLEKRKPREIRTFLIGRKIDIIKDIIDSVSGSGRLIEMALSIHIANKIAHELEALRDNIILYYWPEGYQNIKGPNKRKLYNFL